MGDLFHVGFWLSSNPSTVVMDGGLSVWGGRVDSVAEQQLHHAFGPTLRSNGGESGTLMSVAAEEQPLHALVPTRGTVMEGGPSAT